MKKSDVQLSYHQGNRHRPMINVKNHLWMPDLITRYKGSDHEYGDDAGFWAWVQERFDAGDYEAFDGADEWARESCWEMAQEAAEEVWPGYTTRMIDEKKWFPEFPKGCQHRFTGKKVPERVPLVKVWSEGRMGGWLVVDGLKDVEDWDAIDLAKWAKFNKMIRQLADEEYPYQFIWNLAVNVFERVREDRRNIYPAPNYAAV